jgi:acyl carrier protein
MAVDRSKEVDEAIRKAVAKITRNESVVINPTTTFKELGADSLDVVQIMVSLEETFDIELVDEEMKALNNMGGFIDYVKKKVAEKNK